MTTTTVTLQDVIGFIVTSADDADIDRIHDALRQRRRALAAVTAAAVRPGMDVRLDGLSPKYLNGLTGTVESINGNRCSVLLDEESTQNLRFAGKRFYVPIDMTNYIMRGVPLQCAKVA